MGGSEVTKLLSPILLVAALWLASIHADDNEDKDPIMKDVNVETIPIKEVEIKPDDMAFEHVMDPKEGRELQSALIRNGQEVTGSKFPYIVSLQRKHYNVDRRYHFCAAVLLDARTAVTAAHCVYAWKKYNKYYDMYAGLGFVKLSSSSGKLVKIVDVYINPKYKGYDKGYPHDIAVVVFEKEVTFSSSIQPAALTNTGVRTFSNHLCDLAGWGYNEDWAYPDELYYVKQYWLTNYQCKLLNKAFWYVAIRYKNLCTYAPKTSPCYGDSGGPVVCDGKVAGLISWTVSCSGCFGSVHTRVSAYRDWIADMQAKAVDDYF